mmetsp:Transcript_3013/g.9276  ORF Transcript_3013/g.9276 Transcript_3013/m.9276 type:complete len:259 (+) Transcript_3013:306-1082(+)
MLTAAANSYKPEASRLAMSAPTATMATGPETASLFSLKLNTISVSPPTTPLASRPNSPAASCNASNPFLGNVRVTSASGPSVTPTRPEPSGATCGVTSSGKRSPSRRTTNLIAREPLLRLMVRTTSRTDGCPPGSASPSTSSSTSPDRRPAEYATDPSPTPGTSTPGRYTCCASPTVSTCVNSVASANAMLASTPAETTNARSEAGRLRSRSGSSGSYGQSGSSSGKATYPPIGKSRSAYSTAPRSKRSSSGPKPMEN